jgi:UDP-N-acetylglucosamine transferase subunit ALG13
MDRGVVKNGNDSGRGDCSIWELHYFTCGCKGLPFSQGLIKQARIVIAHCGEGTLLLLDSLDKPYILVSRSQEFKEHVDDHQVELGLALSQMNVPVAWCPGDLVRFIDAPRKASIADVSHASAIALCQSLQSRFGQSIQDDRLLVTGNR